MRLEPQLIFGQDEAIAAWVAQRIPHMHGEGFGPCTAIGVVCASGKGAGIVYHDYQARYGNIQLSMAADTPLWATPATIRALLHYPFAQLGVFMVWTMTPVENTRALSVNEKIGFRRKPIVPNVFGPKKHAQICQMTRIEHARKYGA